MQTQTKHPRIGSLKHLISSVMAIMLAVAVGVAGYVPLAHAKTTAYDFKGEWVNAPAKARSGFDVLNSRWWLDVNDDTATPENNEVAGNVAKLTAENAVFTKVPTVCAGKDSSISKDGSVLTCDLGKITQGTALNFTTSMLVKGPAGAKVALRGEFRGKTVETLSQIPIYTEFKMDAKFNGGTPFPRLMTTEANPQQYLLEFPFSISHAQNSAAGPETVSFDITTERRVDADLVAMDDAEGACQPNDRVQPGYPFSDGAHPANQQTAFPTCTLEKLGTDSFRLTLSGLKYDQTAPSLDSNGEPLPRGMEVIAAGKLRFKLQYHIGGNTVKLTASTPTFEAVDGATSVDDAANNENSVPVVLGYYTGGWGLSYMSPKSYPGIPWTDTFRAPVGAKVMAFVGHAPTRPGETHEHWVCSVIDYKNVELQKVRIATNGETKPNVFYDDSFPTNPDGTRDIWYYEGELHNPGSTAVVKPNEFECGGETSTTDPEAGNQPEWTRTPKDMSKVRAIKLRLSKKITSTASKRGMVYVAMDLKIRDNVKIGTPIWTWGYVLSEGAHNWTLTDGKGKYFDHSMDPEDVKPYGTLTPDLEYPFVGPGRDVLRVVGSDPYVDKQVSQTEYLPNEEAEYRLSFGLESNMANPSPDDLALTDVLPEGLTYVPGSAQFADGTAAPEPTVTEVPAAADGSTPAHTQLAWSFKGVTPNAPAMEMTYRVKVPGDAKPEQSFTSTAVIASQGITRAAEAVFTVPSAGSTSLRKSALKSELKPDEDGAAEGKWIVELKSADPQASTLTDVIDLLPAATDKDGKASKVAKDGKASKAAKAKLELVKVTASLPGSKVYYTTKPRAELKEDPADPSNGSLGHPSDIWRETFTADATAVRVIGGPLEPSATQKITLDVKFSGLKESAKFVNVAVGRADDTRLRMRSSAVMEYTKPAPEPNPEPTPPNPAPNPNPTPTPTPPVPGIPGIPGVPWTPGETPTPAPIPGNSPTPEASPTPDKPSQPVESPSESPLAKTGVNAGTMLVLSSLLLLAGAGLVWQRKQHN